MPYNKDEQENTQQQDSLFSKVKEATSALKTEAGKQQVQEWAEKASQPSANPVTTDKKIGGALSKVEFDENGSAILPEKEVSHGTPGGLFESTINKLSSMEESAKTNPSLYEKYGRKPTTQEEDTAFGAAEVKRQNKEFKLDKHAWADTEGTTGKKRNETNPDDDAYHWDGHTDEKGNWVSGLDEWADDNQARINSGIERFNKTIDDNKYLTEAEVQAEQQEWANLYYDSKELEEYAQTVVDDFKAKYDQTYASASEEDKKAMDAELARLEGNQQVYKNWQDKSKEMYDKWSGLNTVYDTVDDNKKFVTDEGGNFLASYYEENGVRPPEVIQEDMDRVKAIIDDFTAASLSGKRGSLAQAYATNLKTETELAEAQEEYKRLAQEKEAADYLTETMSEVNDSIDVRRSKYLFAPDENGWDWNHIKEGLLEDLDKASTVEERVAIQKELNFVNNNIEYDKSKEYKEAYKDATPEQINDRLLELTYAPNVDVSNASAASESVRKLQNERREKYSAYLKEKDPTKKDAIWADVKELDSRIATAQSQKKGFIEKITGFIDSLVEPKSPMTERELTDDEKIEKRVLQEMQLAIKDEKINSIKADLYAKNPGKDIGELWSSQAYSEKEQAYAGLKNAHNALTEAAGDYSTSGHLSQNTIAHLKDAGLYDEVVKFAGGESVSKDQWEELQSEWAEYATDVMARKNEAYFDKSDELSYARNLEDQELKNHKDYNAKVERGKELYETVVTEAVKQYNSGAKKSEVISTLVNGGFSEEDAKSWLDMFGFFGVDTNAVTPSIEGVAPGKVSLFQQLFPQNTYGAERGYFTKDQINGFYYRLGNNDLTGAAKKAAQLNSDINTALKEEIAQRYAGIGLAQGQALRDAGILGRVRGMGTTLGTSAGSFALGLFAPVDAVYNMAQLQELGQTYSKERMSLREEGKLLSQYGMNINRGTGIFKKDSWNDFFYNVEESTIHSLLAIATGSALAEALPIAALPGVPGFGKTAVESLTTAFVDLNFAGNAYMDTFEELKRAGVDENLANDAAVLSGIAEAFFEHFSVENLVHMKTPRTALQFFRNACIQGPIEMSEELATGVANKFTNYYLLGGDSDYRKQAEKYARTYHITMDEAERMVRHEFIREVALEGVAGLISGFASAAGRGAQFILTDNSKSGKAMYSGYGELINKELANGKNAAQMLGEYLKDYEFIPEGQEKKFSPEDKDTIEAIKQFAEKVAGGNATNEEIGRMYKLLEQYDPGNILSDFAYNNPEFATVSLGAFMTGYKDAMIALFGPEKASQYMKAFNKMVQNAQAGLDYDYVANDLEVALHQVGAEISAEDVSKLTKFLANVLTGDESVSEKSIYDEVTSGLLKDTKVQMAVWTYLQNRIANANDPINAAAAAMRKAQEDVQKQIDAVQAALDASTDDAERIILEQKLDTLEGQKADLGFAAMNDSMNMTEADLLAVVAPLVHTVTNVNTGNVGTAVADTLRGAWKYINIGNKANRANDNAVRSYVTNKLFGKSSLETMAKYRDDGDFFVAKGPDGKDHIFTREFYIQQHKKGIDPLTGQPSAFRDLVDTDEKLNAEFDGQIRSTLGAGGLADMVRYNLRTGEEKTAEQTQRQKEQIQDIMGAYDVNANILRNEIKEIDRQLQDLYTQAEMAKASNEPLPEQHDAAVKNLEERKAKAEADLKIIQERSKVRSNGRIQTYDSGTSGRNAGADERRNAGGIPYSGTGSNSGGSGVQANGGRGSESGNSETLWEQEVILKDGDDAVATMDNGSVIYDSDDPNANTDNLTSEEKDVLQMAKEAGVDRLIFVDADQLWGDGNRAAGYYVIIGGRKIIVVNSNRGTVNGYHEAMHYCLDSYTKEEKRSILDEFVAGVFKSGDEFASVFNLYNNEIHQKVYEPLYKAFKNGNTAPYYYALYEEMLCDLWHGLNRYHIPDDQFKPLQQRTYAFVVQKQIVEHAADKAKRNKGEKKSEVKKAPETHGGIPRAETPETQEAPKVQETPEAERTVEEQKSMEFFDFLVRQSDDFDLDPFITAASDARLQYISGLEGASDAEKQVIAAVKKEVERRQAEDKGVEEENRPKPLDTSVGEARLAQVRETVRNLSTTDLLGMMREVANLLNQLSSDNPDRIILEPVARILINEYTNRLSEKGTSKQEGGAVISDQPAVDLPPDNPTGKAGEAKVDPEYQGDTEETEESDTEEGTGNPLKDELAALEKEIQEIEDNIKDIRKDRDQQIKNESNKDMRDLIKGQANDAIKYWTDQVKDLKKRATAIRSQLLKESKKNKRNNRGSVRDANIAKGSKKKPNPSAATHIDNRSLGSVGKTNVNAFQYDNPEIKPFFKRAAEILMHDLIYLQSTRRNEYGNGTFFEAETDFLAAVRSNFKSIDDAIAACEAVIYDEGGENYVGPKRIELFLDQMLTNGYTPINLDSETIEPSMDYINLKGSLEGGTPFDARQKAIDDLRLAYLEDGLTDEELGKIVDENKARTGYYDPYTRDGLGEATETTTEAEPETTEQPEQTGRNVSEIDAEMEDVSAEIESLLGQIENAPGNVSEDKYAELNERLREREAYYDTLQAEWKDAYATGRFSVDDTYSPTIPDLYGKFSVESLANGTGFETLYQSVKTGKLTTLEDWIRDVQSQPREPGQEMPTRDSLQEEFSRKVKYGEVRVYGVARRNADGTLTEMHVETITSEDMKNSPLGFLIACAEENGRISKEEAERQYDFLRDLTRMLFHYHDEGLIWEVVGSEMFAAIKSNSDPQYNRTIDFSTICKKTQAVIDAVGMTMQLLDTGLSKDEIKLVYKLVGEAGESTPCPVCYVFSRWMGLGSVLDNIKRYQQLYGETTPGGKEKVLELVKEVQRVAEAKMEGTDLTFGKAVNAAQKDVELRLKVAESAFNDYEKALKNPNAKKYKGRNITTDENGNPRSQDYWAEQISSLAKEYDKFDAYKWAVKTRLINADLLVKNSEAVAAKLARMGIEGETLNEILENAKNSNNDDEDFVALWDELQNNLTDLEIVDEDRLKELHRKQELRKQQSSLKAAVTREFGKDFTNGLKKLSAIEQALKEHPDSVALKNLYENRKEFDAIGEEYVFRKGYRDVPDEILFDLNQGEKFARYYPATWSYRTTRGSGLGKAIMPYSDARVGEIIQGMAVSDVKNIQIGKDKNAFLNLVLPEKREEAKKILATARKKMAAQNLIGGMRFQSTSDFRYEYASDYLMAFFEMQAMGANVQLYTKVLEAVDFFANVGCDVNLSVMPRDKGIGELTEKPSDWDTNYDRYFTRKNNKYVRLKKGDVAPKFVPGKYHAILYSDVTGVNGGAAREYVQKYDNVQMIMVGISADHINACLDSDDITFVIPFHGSGNSTKDIQQLMQLLGETIDAKNITDFTPYQTDVEKEKNSPARNLRKKIVSGGCLINGRITLTTEEANILEDNVFLKDLFRRFYLDATDRNGRVDRTESERNRQNITILNVHDDGTTSVNTDFSIDFGKANDQAFAKKYYLDGKNECYGNFLSGITANQIFPYEYWDKSLKQSEAKGNGDAFQEYCKSLGLIPRFSGWAKGKYTAKNDFTKNDNYWKLLIDRKMYDNQGNYRAQRQIDLSNVDAFRHSDESYEGDRRIAVTDLNPNYGQVTFGNNSPFANRVNPKVNGKRDNSVISKINDPRKKEAIAAIAATIIKEARNQSDSRTKRRLFADSEDIRQAIDAGDYITAARMLIEDPGTRFFEENGTLYVETDEGTMRVQKNGDLIPVENTTEQEVNGGTSADEQIESIEGKYSVAGPSAEEADLGRLDTAMWMEVNGYTEDEIWLSTGWYRGMEGKWKWEIYDKDIRLNRDALRQNLQRAEILEKYNADHNSLTDEEQALLSGDKSVRIRGAFKLPEFLTGADALFANYPKLRDVNLVFVANNGNLLGEAIFANNTIEIDLASIKRVTGGEWSKVGSQTKSTILHEIQHFIQRYENSNQGASVGYWEDLIKNDPRELVPTTGVNAGERLYNIWRKRLGEDNYQRLFDLANLREDARNGSATTAEYEKSLKQNIDQFGLPTVSNFLHDAALYNEFYPYEERMGTQDARDLYRRTAGEIEARDVEHRRNLSQEDRRTQKPFTTPKAVINNSMFSAAGKYSVDEQDIEAFNGWLNWDTPSDGTINYHDFENMFRNHPETDFYSKMIQAAWAGGSTKAVEKEFQQFVSSLDEFARVKLRKNLSGFFVGSNAPYYLLANTPSKTAVKLHDRLTDILDESISPKKEFKPLTEEQLNAYRPDYIAAIQQMQDRDSNGNYIGDSAFHKSHQALYDLFQRYPELDYMKRLAYAKNGAEKDSIRAEFSKLLSGIDDRYALWQLSAYSIYPSRGIYNGGYGVSGEYDRLNRVNRIFSNTIEKRRNQILEEIGFSSNVKLKAREYTLQEIRDVFNQLNHDEQLNPLAEKVFGVAGNLGLTIRGAKGTAFRKSYVGGQQLGSVVEYNINRFNDLRISDQVKAGILLHELIHSCTQYAMKCYDGVYQNLHITSEMRDAVRQIKSVYEAVKADPSFIDKNGDPMYGTENASEMLSELSNPEFREALEKKNLWQRIVDAIKKFFGIDTKNALDAASVGLDYLLDNFNYDAYLRWVDYANRRFDNNRALTQKAKDAIGSRHPGQVKLSDSYWVNQEYAEQDEDGEWNLKSGYFHDVYGNVFEVDPITGEYAPAGSRDNNSQQDGFMSGVIDDNSNYTIDGFFDSFGNEVTVGKFSADDGILSATYFAGAGTLDYALRDRLFHLYAVEYDPDIRDVFIKNNGNTIMVTDADVNEVDPYNVKLGGHVQYFHASPVCKNFSMANNKRGETEMDIKFARSIVKALYAWKPKVFTLENVAGYKNSKSFEIIKEALRDIYGEENVNWDFDIYSAANYGAYTNRKRLFVRAVLEDKLPSKPQTTGSKTWWDAAEDLVNEAIEKGEAFSYEQGLTQSQKTRLGKMKNLDDGKYYHLDIDHLTEPVLILGGNQSGYLTFATASKASPTLTTKGGSARIIMPDKTVIKMTPEIYGAIQGLDKEFQFPRQKKHPEKIQRTKSFTIVGNGIPTQLTQAVVNPLLDIIDKRNGKYSADDEQMASTLQMYEDLVDPSEWKASEHQNMNGRMYNRISNGISLWDKVVSFYDTVDEDNYNWLSYEDITQAMRINPYNGNVDGEDMPLASEVMWSLLHLARDQESDVKERIYSLMEEIAPHLVRTEQDKWIRPVGSRFPPIDFDFSNWYNERNPMPEVGYTPKSLEQLRQEAVEAANQADLERRAYRRSLATEDEYNRAAEKARRAWNMYNTRFNAEQGKGKFSVDIDPDAAFDSFGYEVELDDYSPVVTQSDLSSNLYYSEDGNTAYYQTPTGETVVLDNIGEDSPEARYINYLEATNNANNTNNATTEPYIIPPANRNGNDGYNINQPNAGLRRGAEEVLTQNQERALRSAGSNGELYAEGVSQSEETQGVRYSADEESPGARYSTMYDADSDTFVNEKGETVATDNMYPIGSFTREIFKAMKSGDQSLKNVEDIINKLLDRNFNLYEEDVNTVRRMIQINDAYTPEQRKAMMDAMDKLVKKHGKMRSAKEDKNQDIHFAVQRDQGDTIDDPNHKGKKITRKEFVKRATEGKDPFTGEDSDTTMTEKEANKLFDQQGTVIMKFTQTVARNSDKEWLTAETVRMALTDESMSYTPVPNDKAIRLAEERFRKAGTYEKALAEWDGIVHSERTPKQVDVAYGELLLQKAVDQGRINDTVKLVSDLTLMAHTTGQTLQAFRILKKLTPRGQLYYLQSVVDDLNKRYDSRIRDGKMGRVTLNQGLVERLLASSTREELDKAVDRIKEDLAKQIPATWADQWNAWRYLAMLGNPRTHFRNLFGNAAFMPAVFVKDMIARRLENKYVDPNLRMRIAGADLSKNSVYRQRAEQDFQVMRKIIAGEASGNKYSDIQDILGQRDVFAWKALNDLVKLNGGALTAEDLWFMEKYYTRAFAEALQARGIKEEDVQTFDATPEGRKILNEIRNWATLEAQRNTYHDANKLASLINQMKRSSPAAYVLLEGLAPFTKTPANILKRGIEYSPLGLISSCIQFNRDLKNGEYSTSQCIDRLAAGLTGSLFTALGFILGHGLFGIKLRGAGPDDKKEGEFEKLQGHQAWSIEIGNFSYTLDWMAPSALPLFIGQGIYSMLKKGGFDFTDMDTWMILTRLADPLLSLSMLDGIENTLTSLSNAQNTSALGVLWTSMAGSYIAQGMPTIFGQAARIIDPYRRQTFVAEDEKSSAMKKWVQSSIQAKLPGFGKFVGVDLLPSEENKKLYVDMWGRTKDSSSLPETLWRIAENFISPGYHSRINETPVDAELQRLYEATEDKSALPTYLQKSINNQSIGKDDEGNEIVIDGKKLNADEMTKYEMTVGQNRYQLLSDIFASPEYQAATDTEKLKMVDDAYKYAKDLGDRAIIPEREHDSHWMEVAEKIGASDYIVLRQEYENNKSNEKIFSWLASNPNLTEDQVATLIADKFNPPDNVSSISSDGFLYDLNGSDEDAIKEINAQIIQDGLKTLLSSEEYKNAPDKDVMLKQFYEDSRAETLKVYGEMLDQTDRVKYIGKAASIGAESFSKVLDLTTADVKGDYRNNIEAQSSWLGYKYKADTSINNPLHEGYSIELDKTQRSRLESKFRDRWNAAYDELLHSEKFQNAPSREYQEDMIARRFNQVSTEVENEYAAELYQAGGYSETFGKPGSFTWSKAYEIADRELSTPQERGEWLAGKYSPGSSIDDPDQAAYEIPLTTEDKNQLKKEFASAYVPRYVKMVTSAEFKALDPTTQEYKKEELRKDVAKSVQEAYARKLKADGYASVAFDDKANLANKYEYLASNELSDAEKIQIIKDSYVGGTIANAEARGYRKKMFDEWMDNPANTKSYLEQNTADAYEKMRKAADKYAGTLTKQKYGNVKNYSDIEDFDLYDVYYTTNNPIDSTPPVKIDAPTTSKADSGALLKPGNIDLNARPIMRNSDGTYSTVESVTWEVDGQFVNVPTVIYVDGEEINGEWVEGWVHVDGDTALDHYFETGEHLGIYSDEESAVKAAKQLHVDQAKQYDSKANFWAGLIRH